MDHLRSIPLCIDLDGTLVKTDTLLELLLLFLRSKSFKIYLIPFWIACGRARFKTELARQVALDPAILPRHKPLIDYINKMKKKGRPLVLVTAASEQLTHAVADFFGCFDEILASSGDHNLRGPAKLACLLDRYGPRGFDYAGNDHTDVIIWKQARLAILVNPGPGVAVKATRCCNNPLILDDRKPVLQAIRLLLGSTRWIENILLFLPWLLFKQDPDVRLVSVCMAYAIYSLSASAIQAGAALYFLNRDRRSADYRRNPLASGDLPLLLGYVVPPLLLVLSAIFFIATNPFPLSLYLGYLAEETWRQARQRRQGPPAGLVITACIYFLLLFSGLCAARLPVSATHLVLLGILATGAGLGWRYRHSFLQLLRSSTP